MARDTLGPAILLLAAIGGTASPAGAALVTPQGVAAMAYVRARAADSLGQLQASASGYAATMALDPGDTAVASRAYRAALAAGDRGLALKALHVLDGSGMAPADGPLLTLTQAFLDKDWAAARTTADALEKAQVLAFLLPPIRAWIAYGAKSGDALAALTPAATVPAAAAAPYASEHRTLLLFAEGRTDDALAAMKTLTGPGGGATVRLRLVAASALTKAGRKADALATVESDESVLAAARARIEAGQPPIARAYTAADGLADLLIHLAIDVNRQRVSPSSLAFARMASFLAPDNAVAWLAISDVLAQSGRPQAAIGALANIPPADLFADTAMATRVRLLVATNDKVTALAEAQARVTRGTPGADDWLRLGDLYADLDRLREAADAYGKALALAEADKRPAAQLWPILLTQGSMLDRAGDWPSARKALGRAAALAPDEPVVLNAWGYSQLEKRENVAAARKLVEKASRLKPDDPSITDSLGWSYYLTGDLPRAIDALERAAQGDPAEAAISEHLGDAYWKAGRRYEARYAWRAALVVAEEADGKRIQDKIATGLSDRTAAP